jgi:predicted TIM-barrel fold metal-dependent hydrolase
MSWKDCFVVPYQSRISNKIDVHTHLFADTDCMLHLMDRQGIEKSVLLAIGMDSPDVLKYNESICFKRARKNPTRLAVMVTFDLSRIDEKDYALLETERLERGKEAGAVGVKVSKELGLFARDRAGNLIVADDPRLDPLWDKAGELKLPVLIHVADPPAYWRPVNEDNPWRVLLGEMTGWVYHGRERFPSFNELMHQRNNILRRHPNTTFIGAHLGSCAWDMEVSGVVANLEEFPNFHVDASAVVDEIGRHPETTRELFMKYPDRIMHGTDLAVLSAWENHREIERWTDEMEQSFSSIFRFYETSDEEISPTEPRLRDWNIKGIDLPDDVLRRIYYENARRIIPGLGP